MDISTSGGFASQSVNNFSTGARQIEDGVNNLKSAGQDLEAIFGKLDLPEGLVENTGQQVNVVRE